MSFQSVPSDYSPERAHLANQTQTKPVQASSSLWGLLKGSINTVTTASQTLWGRVSHPINSYWFGNIEAFRREIQIESPNSFAPYQWIDSYWGRVMVVTDPAIMRQFLTEDQHCFRDPGQTSIKYIIGDLTPETLSKESDRLAIQEWLKKELQYEDSWLQRWFEISKTLVEKSPENFQFNIQKAATYYATQATIEYLLGPSFVNQEIIDSVEYLNHVIPWVQEQKANVESVDDFMIVPDKSKPIKEAIESIKNDLSKDQSLIKKMYESNQFSDEQVVQTGKWLFFTLHGMITSLSCSSLHAAAKYPEWQRLLLDEESGLEGFENFMKEVLRMYPPVWMMKRRTIQSVRIGATKDLIPPESDVMLSPYFSQRDVIRWPNPENFNPQRHSDHENPPMTPFGQGGPQTILQDVVIKISQCFLLAMLKDSWVALPTTPVAKVEGKQLLHFNPELKLNFKRKNPHGLEQIEDEAKEEEYTPPSIIDEDDVEIFAIGDEDK